MTVPLILGAVFVLAVAWGIADARRARRLRDNREEARRFAAMQERAALEHVRPHTGNVDNLGPR